jgi:hypothetical protein
MGAELYTVIATRQPRKKPMHLVMAKKLFEFSPGLPLPVNELRNLYISFYAPHGDTFLFNLHFRNKTSDMGLLSMAVAYRV